jgi:DNA-binding PadR family transcriptional regulator
MRMTMTVAVVLQAIARGHQYGFELVDVTGFPTGTVYPALRRLEHAGYLRSAWERETTAFNEGRPQRRYYEITPAGTHALEAAMDQLRPPSALRARSLKPVKAR